MTYSHKGTVIKISEIIFNMRIFAIEVIRTSNRLIFSDFSNLYKKLAKLAVWRDFFSTSTSKHQKRLAYPHREFISVQEYTISFNKK